MLAELDHANAVRFAAAQVKREIRAGSLTVAEAVRDPRAQILTVGSLLCAQYRWGRKRTHEALEELRYWTQGPSVVALTPNQRLRALSDRQRDAFAEYLAETIGEARYRPIMVHEGPYVPTAPLRDWLQLEFSGWTYAALARYCHVDEAAMRRILSGEFQQISVHYVDRVLVGLECPHLFNRLYPEVTL